MAEQAINTIYALGEHPDILCNEIIKALTRRVFAKERTPKKREQSPSAAKDADAMDEDKDPDEVTKSDSEKESQAEQDESPGDTGDAFELSQLLRGCWFRGEGIVRDGYVVYRC